MENLQIEGTATLPNVEMNSNGKVKFVGRALPEDAVRFFYPIITWLSEYQGSSLEVDFNLEYFNTSVSKQLHDFLSILNGKPQDCSISVIWQYEEGDDEMLESGEIYNELFPRLNFQFKEYEEFIE
jgi:hypothetical protein